MRMKKLKIIIFFALIALIANSAFGKDAKVYPVQWRIGITAMPALNFHSPLFDGLPGIPSCCPEYESGSGIGLLTGGFFDLPLKDDLFAGVAISYRTLDGMLLTEQNQTFDANGGYTEGTIEHSIDSKINLVEIKPKLNYYFSERLNIEVGIGISYLLSSDFQQKEMIVSPSDKYFIDSQSKSRFTFSGEIPETNSLLFGINAGISYDLPMNEDETMHIVPKAGFSYQINDLIKTDPWKIMSVMAGISLRYSNRFIPEPIIPIPAPMPDVYPAPEPPPVPEIARLEGNIETFLVEPSGREGPADLLTVRNIVSIKPYAPLNYVFFAKSSAEIPDRYVLLDKKEVRKFTVEQFNGVSTLKVYYNILNIIGSKLKANDELNVVLTGCNSNTGAEENNLELSGNRAMSVADYLKKSWGIETERIKINARNLPASPSSQTTKDGLEENQRVEITFEGGRILEPIVFFDTTRIVDRPILRVKPNIIHDAPVENWSVSARQNGHILFSETRKGRLPNKIDWNIEKLADDIPTTEKEVFVAMTVSDDRGNFLKTLSKPLRVNQIIRQEKRIEQYSLIIFEFNTSTLSEENKNILKIIRSSIEENSEVKIVGYTDRTGDAEYNQQLSTMRANAIADALNVDRIRASGEGSNTLLFPNNTPEGRFYCRTVRITIETPL